MIGKTCIVIRTYNENALVGRTLEAVMSQSEQAFEIVIVDSGSSDGTLDIVRKFNKLKIIEIPKRDFTYGKALNLGIESVGEDTEFIALLSAHSIPCNNDWLRELLTPFQDGMKIAGVYGKQVVLPEHMGNPIVRVLNEIGYPYFFSDFPFYTKYSYFFSNANSAIRYKVWKIHRFNETMSTAEDHYWCKTVISEGGWIAYQPTAMVYHSHPDNYLNYYLRSYREEKEFRRMDPMKYPTIRREALVRRIREIYRLYRYECKHNRKLYGTHLDYFGFELVRIIAEYQGRKDANNG